MDFDIRLGVAKCVPLEPLTDNQVDCRPPTNKPNKDINDTFCDGDTLSTKVCVHSIYLKSSPYIAHFHAVDLATSPTAELLSIAISVFLRLYVCLFVRCQVSTKVSTATDRPARHKGSAHAKYSVLHQMVIKLFLLLCLAAECRSRRWL